MTVHKILVAEDERALAEAIKLKLAKHDLEVVAVESVDAAEKALEKEGPFSAIWLDHYLLGKRNGLDFVRDLKESHHSEVPIYVVSNSSGDDKIATYIKLGVEKYYVKSNHRLEEIVGDILTHIAKD